MRTVWRYQFKMLLRNPALLVGIFFVFITALYAGSYGRHFVQQQQQVLYSVDTVSTGKKAKLLELLKQQDTISSQPSLVSNSRMSMILGGQKTLSYRPSAFASLSIGQKDNLPFYHETGPYTKNIYSVTSTDVQNPLKLQSGNFDLAFVFLYLFPLFIIALGYNVYAGEKEARTLPLLRIEVDIHKLVRDKLLFYMVLILALSVLINILCCWMNGIFSSGEWAQMLGWQFAVLAYIVFWFSAVYLVVSLALSGATTALVLGGVYIFLLLLMPSVVSRYISAGHEKEQVQSMFASRGDLFSAYDLDSAALVSNFKKLEHPYPFPELSEKGQMDRGSYLGAMQDELQVRFDNSLGQAVAESQRKEHVGAVSMNWLNPVYAVQNTFNQIAGTEINNYLDYLASVEAYQTRTRYHMYRYSLEGRIFSRDDYRELPAYTFQQPELTPERLFALLIPVLLMAVILIAMAVKIGARTLSQKLQM